MSNEVFNIADFADKLKILLCQSLPGFDAHKLMIPSFPGKAPEYFNNGKEIRDAAVLIILFVQDDILKTVFIERMPDPGPHSGQIAFPGGRKEVFDVDLIDTALREAEEEIGVSVGRDKVWGSLTPIQIPISGFSVLPVVCVIDEIPVFNICEDEVRGVFAASLFDLFDSETNRIIRAREMQINAPCFTVGENIIWGATAMVLKEFKTILS